MQTLRTLAALALVGVFTSAQAMTYFLTSDFYKDGKHHCEYGNDAVLIVTGLCPLHIDG